MNLKDECVELCPLDGAAALTSVHAHAYCLLSIIVDLLPLRETLATWTSDAADGQTSARGDWRVRGAGETEALSFTVSIVKAVMAASDGIAGVALQMSGRCVMSMATTRPTGMRDESCVTSYGNEKSSQHRRPPCVDRDRKLCLKWRCLSEEKTTS